VRMLVNNLCAVVVMASSTLSYAAEPETVSAITSSSEALSDEDLDRRLDWLTTTLDGAATYSKLWQYGWSSGYTLGIGIGTAQAVTTNKNDTMVNGIVTASKAVIGTARLLLAPHPGRLGAGPMREIVGDDRASKLRRLTVGELQLSRAAERAEDRLRWQRHTGNVLLNAVGGAFIFGFGDPVDAAISIAVGIAVGELMIFTSPKAAESELQSYRERFAGAPPPKWRVSLAPMANGAAIRIQF
jgi:hypothetical protein